MGDLKFKKIEDNSWKTKPGINKALVFLKKFYFCNASSLIIIMNLYDTKIYQIVVYVDHMIHFADNSSFGLTGYGCNTNV